MISLEIEERIFDNSFSVDETLKYFSGDSDYTEDLLRMLDKALCQINPGAIETLLYACSCNGHLDQRYSLILTRLLTEPKIQNHNLETVIESLHFIKDPKTVDNLYEACLKFEYSDEHSIPIKAMWALRDIGTNRAIEKLILLSKVEDGNIQRKAEQQLNYLNEKEEST